MNQNTKNTIRITILTAVGFIGYFFLDENFFGEIRSWINSILGHLGWSHFITYLIVGVPVFLVLFILHGARKTLLALGVSKGLKSGLLIAFICTLPMFIGYAIVFEWNHEFNWSSLFMSVICAGLFEEVYFRGFLFGQIYRFTKIGFIPAILFGAIFFASVHLYQSQDLDTLIGIFLITFAGAILFAWVYIEWNENLWVSIFLHMFMNLSWMLFSAGENALGGFYSNLFRFMTIAIIIVGTIIYKRKNGLKLSVNKSTIWMDT